MMILTLTSSSSCRLPAPETHRSSAGAVPGPSSDRILLRRSHRSLRLVRAAVESSQSQAAAVINKETGGDTMVTAAGIYDPACMSSDFFLTYTPPSQRSEQWMRERADELKGQVRRMFVTGIDMSTADMLSLVDTLERLGIGNHFHEEIDVALSRIHSEEQECDRSSDLHAVALRFGLLRQHGFWVSTDVFDKFRDAAGNFSIDLSTDTRGLLSLYNASYMAIPGEVVLDDAIDFGRRHLEATKCNLRSPMVEQVSRALEIPRPRFSQQLETMFYITEFEQEEAHDITILELARVEFNIVRSLYITELKNLSLWWRDLYNDVNLTYARNRLVETYMYTTELFPQENSRARITLAKVFALMALVDDTYDTHATLEECQIFTEAIQRWDESMIPILPEYLRMLYIKILRNIKETEDYLEPWEKNRMADVQKSIKMLCKGFLMEAEWFSRNYTPSFKEHIGLSMDTSAMSLLLHVALMGAGVTKEAFDWALDRPDMVKGLEENFRFLNDISSYSKPRDSKKDVASAFECYMKEHDVTPEDATAAFKTMVEHAWRRINQAYMELDRGILPAAQVVASMARLNELCYLQGRDAYTFGDTQDAVASLLLKDLPV